MQNLFCGCQCATLQICTYYTCTRIIIGCAGASPPSCDLQRIIYLYRSTDLAHVLITNVFCKGKVTATNDILCECGRCGTTQKIDLCKQHHCARIDLESEGTITTLNVFTPITDQICQGSVSKVFLLMSEPFNLTYSPMSSHSLVASMYTHSV